MSSTPLQTLRSFSPQPRRASLRQTGRLFARIRFAFTPLNAIEGSFSFSPSDLFQKRLQPTLPVLGFAKQKQDLDIYSVNYVRYLRKEGRVRPFLTAGIGLAYFLNAFTGHNAAWNFGGGADFRINDRIALRMEYRDFIMNIPQINPGSSPSGKIHNQVPSVGIVIRF